MKEIDFNVAVERAKIIKSLEVAAEPAILRGFARSLPMYSHFLSNAAGLLSHIEKSCNSTKLVMLESATQFHGLIGYRETQSRLSFDRVRVNTSTFFDRLRRSMTADIAPTMSLQSTRVDDFFYDLLPEVNLDVWPEVVPRLWIGNQTRVPAHIDDAHNIAVNIVGTRVFRLLPPSCLSELYVGSVEYTPSGAAISLLDLAEIDCKAFPRAASLESKLLTVTLNPGDAIYIPPLWWHQVNAQANLNILLNYWKGGSIEKPSRFTPFQALYLSALVLKNRSATDKASWREFYEYYVFGDEAIVSDHIDPKVQGILGALNDEEVAFHIDRILTSIVQK